MRWLALGLERRPGLGHPPYRVLAAQIGAAGPEPVWECWIDDGAALPPEREDACRNAGFAPSRRMPWTEFLAIWADVLTQQDGLFVWRLATRWPDWQHWARGWALQDLEAWASIAFPGSPGKAMQAQNLLPEGEDAAVAALTSAALTQAVLNRLASLPRAVRQELGYVLGVQGGLQWLLELEAPPSASDDQPSPALAATPPVTDVLEFFGQDGPLQATLPGYRPRESQVEMASRVMQALQEDKLLLVEAPTGTGKSLAYLMPAMAMAARHHKRVVVSTYTVGLQEQLWEKDLPLLQRCLPLPVALLKGRSRYLCLLKIAQQRQHFRPLAEPAGRRWAWARLYSYAAQSDHGEVDGLDGRSPELRELLEAVLVDRDACRGSRCPWAAPCFWRKSRARAEEAAVVVVNHALLASHLAEGQVLPDFAWLVVDEAHHFAEVAEQAFGLRLELDRFSRRVLETEDRGFWEALAARQELTPGIRAFRQALQPLAAATVELARRLAGWANGEAGEGRQAWRVTDAVVGQWEADGTAQALQRVRELGEAAAQRGLDLWGAAEDLFGPDVDAEPAWFGLRQRLADLARGVKGLQSWGAVQPGWVDWWEVSMQDGEDLCLNRVPLNVGPELERTLWSRVEAAVLTSATLSQNGDFRFATERLGLPGERLHTRRLPSPFNLARQARLAVPTDFPPVDSPLYLPAVAEFVQQAAGLIRGRTLVLVNAHRVLRQLAELLREPLAQKGIRVLAQGLDGPGSRLVERFRLRSQAVLIGTAGLWEGIDIPGADLSLVVIARLPFRSPADPVEAGHWEALTEAGRSPFWEWALPAAVLRFQQGFGRLVRSQHDRGMVVVLDRRCLPGVTRYGPYFLRAVGSVPWVTAPTANVLEALQRFLGVEGGVVD